MIKKFPNHNSIFQAKALLKSIRAPEPVEDTEPAPEKIKEE
ncbi:hypothetical protein MNB_SUP05-13-461 [hydrothermal vent metagenome]|uniref:Uncharacterized protein n=1 Tax=hydrothermal vent metagenome TaxID=652676 RepID=A0A1W1DG55_9ZZZZ